MMYEVMLTFEPTLRTGHFRGIKESVKPPNSPVEQLPTSSTTISSSRIFFKMFSRLSATLLYVLLTFSILAAANPAPWGQPTTTTPTPPKTTTVTVVSPFHIPCSGKIFMIYIHQTGPTSTVTATPASQCNTGDLQCCNSVQSVRQLVIV